MHKRIFSGVQPNENLHLGNYLGALKNWVSLQHDAESFFCVVDLHALTVLQDPVRLREHIIDTAITYIAAGIDPKKSTIFVQSMVPAHAELCWLLACQTPLGWLNRMTQYKDKAGAHQEKQKLGLYAYPVLMAADILLYRATHVPVGEDQKQHLELARDLAQLMNRHYKKELFVVPDVQILGPATRVMSLKDGAKKMSKSDLAVGSRINLLDDAEVIHKKIKKATTDSLPFPDTVKDLENRAEVKNLIHIYAALKNITPQEVCDQYGGNNFSSFKEDLSMTCVDTLSPIRDRFLDMKHSPKKVKDILDAGAEKARSVAHKTLAEIKDTLGLPV